MGLGAEGSAGPGLSAELAGNPGWALCKELCFLLHENLGPILNDVPIFNDPDSDTYLQMLPLES